MDDDLKFDLFHLYPLKQINLIAENKNNLITLLATISSVTNHFSQN